MNSIGLTLLGVAALIVLYPYVLYPALLAALGAVRPRPPLRDPSSVRRWPSVSITVPVYNEEGQIRELLESLLDLDYPSEELQILIVSDASSDGTDRIVREYEPRGIELLRLDGRMGKTAAENAARHHLSGEIVVNTDASIRIQPNALEHLVAALEDPDVGVASGRDVSVAEGEQGSANPGESGYVGYEMWVRRLENRVDGIVGASGCLYAIRRELHRIPVPEALSRDFISALNARERGFRAVSVDRALCLVPRTPSMAREYRRKVRTLTRGMQTLLHKRALLGVKNYGLFSWMLFSHKVARWLLPWGCVLGLAGLVVLSPAWTPARWALGAAIVGGLAAGVPWLLERRGASSSPPRALALPGYVAAGVLAVAHAQLRVLTRRHDPVWEPTRRRAAEVSGSGGD